PSPRLHTLSLHDALPIYILGDPTMLRELLSNLIDNALRYTPAGGSVTVRVRPDAGLALLEVEDTGPGIAPAERQQVFERFYRILDRKSTRLNSSHVSTSY